jgi:hypothetical protein
MSYLASLSRRKDAPRKLSDRCRKRPPAKVALEGDARALGLGTGKRVGAALGRGDLATHGLERGCRHAAVAQLSLDHPPAARPMPITLLGPPADERSVVHVSHALEGAEGRRNHLGVSAGALKPTLDLSTRAWTRRKEANREIEGRGGVRRLSRGARAAAHGSGATRLR